MKHDSMLKARNISKTFGTLRVLSDIDIDIEPSKVTTIVGPSGAGKSTLLQILGTIMSPDRGGEVLYDGTEVTSLPDAQLSRFRNLNIGFVFQFHQLLPEFTLVENVAMPALIAGKSRKEAFAAARSLLNRLGLEGRDSHRPNELSGGECQRAAVARALINNPKVIFADEPSGSLDSHNRSELHRLFFDLRDTIGATFVIVTHDESLAADSDIIIRMADGAIKAVERPADNLSDKQTILKETLQQL